MLFSIRGIARNQVAVKKLEELEELEEVEGLLFAYQDYLELVDWSGRIVRDDKRDFIDYELPPILSRLHIAPERWRSNVTQFEFIHARRFNRLKPSIDSG
jgi:hypothetical protein